MRQWHVNPRVMCDRHLLGEHVEHHMFVGTILKQKSIQGYLDGNLLEPLSLKSRHDALVEEMLRRGMNHLTPLEMPCLDHLKQEQRQKVVDKTASCNELLTRCPRCKSREGA